MGSDSDLPIVQETTKILERFAIPFEITIISAHRTPDRAVKHSNSLIERGIKVVIAAAGGAAHLAGVIAASTTLPVIGLPIMSKTLSGVDSLYSIVQMPPGVPVATVAINGGTNAGLLAIQILALSDNNLQTKFSDFKLEMASEVTKKSEKLQNFGIEEYLKRK